MVRGGGDCRSMSEKTLYISDLDGTLLHRDETTSAYTNDVINSLLAKGMCFSYATARSYVTASKVTRGLNGRFPVIVYNGAFILDNETQNVMLSNFFTSEETEEIREALTGNDISPIVYAFVDEKEKFSYDVEALNSGLRSFLSSRKGDIRDNPVSGVDALFAGKAFYFTCIDLSEKLLPVYERFQNKYHCVYGADIYTGNQWLEIMPAKATKANAILQLKEHLRCDRVVAFGDGKNDISMFQIADECYAVENAAEELKAIASGVIASNQVDGVAKWLCEHVRYDFYNL
jgi:Cof subfamily protein (haloacid dehalogenase superfamily)